MERIETKRLILRDWCEDDFGCLVYDEGTIRYLIAKKNNYAVVLKEIDFVIGTIGLNEDADGNADTRNVGIRLLEQYQNKGLMTEALQAIFEAPSFAGARFSWLCRVDDKRSQYLAKKLDFSYEKTFSKEQYSLPIDFCYYTRYAKNK